MHRDLKPANVKLSPSGHVKLLDFGLATERLPFDMDREGTPEVTPYTIAGVILGTCAYMSPEQARGQPVDKRADIWAFGCILFELLTGRRAFRGETASDTIAAVLERQPDWSLLPDPLPASIRVLLRRCLEKDLHRRLHDIADVRIEVEDALRSEASSDLGSSTGAARRRSFATVASLAVPAIACTALGWWGRDAFVGAPQRMAPLRSTWPIPAGMRLQSPPVVSPDGQKIAFTATTTGALPRLYVRRLNALDAQAIARTDGAMKPFWSPDSRTLAYFAGGRLMKVAVDGGAPAEICATANLAGGAGARTASSSSRPGRSTPDFSRVS